MRTMWPLMINPNYQKLDLDTPLEQDINLIWCGRASCPPEPVTPGQVFLRPYTLLMHGPRTSCPLSGQDVPPHHSRRWRDRSSETEFTTVVWTHNNGHPTSCSKNQCHIIVIGSVWALKVCALNRIHYHCLSGQSNELAILALSRCI